jgi:deazaflavin-dependent oxidoreductase (nitroreductase family)
MPSDLILKAMNAVHRTALLLTRGRIGWTVSHMPALELTTTGRRSGQPRSVMLTSPVQEGSTLVVVASRGGDDNAPAWYLNLRANPAVDVSFQGGAVVRMHARVASAEERARLWPLVIADHSNYADYQTKTQREIPLVLLDPRE